MHGLRHRADPCPPAQEGGIETVTSFTYAPSKCTRGAEWEWEELA